MPGLARLLTQEFGPAEENGSLFSIMTWSSAPAGWPRCWNGRNREGLRTPAANWWMRAIPSASTPPTTRSRAGLARGGAEAADWMGRRGIGDVQSRLGPSRRRVLGR